ncbi:MAG: GHKL domain-containing protein [Deltaproteobacteria bacterium]|nr:GHKL domain-containing protein [Deltaproteobacteria bacterium]
MSSYFRGEQPDNTFSVGYMVSALIILLLFSVLALISAVGIYRISIEGSKNLLENRAVDIAVSLSFTLERIGLRNELFPELVATDKWDDLAFLVLYDQHGTVLLHSNPLMVGRSQIDSDVEKVILEKRPEIHFSTLATGEEVFVLDFPLHLHFSEQGNSGNETDIDLEQPRATKEIEPTDNAGAYCLRISIHPYPAQTILRKANFQLVLIGLSLTTLWVLTFFFLWAWRSNYRLEARLHKQERMAALGEMAAVLAHEIRNPLSSIKGFAQFYLEGTTDPDERADFSVIVEESRRLESLTADLLTYARPTMLNEERFDTERFCQDTKRSIAPLRGHVKFHMSCEKLELRLDREKLMQVVFNLVQNAIDAVSEIKGGEVWFSMKSSGSVLMLIVEDNGPGLALEVKNRLFEPFVTTKTKGTGLGLAIVDRLLETMGGEISFMDREGGGVIVKITLPYHLIEFEVPKVS